MRNSVFVICLLNVGLLFSKEWKYLESESFKTRYVVAADFMKDMDYVVEVGGYKTPITDFLPDNVAAASIDPLSTPRDFGNKRVIKGYFPGDFQMPDVDDYGVVLIGLHIKDMSNSDWNQLITLIRKAKKVVIGFPQDWNPSHEQHRKIVKSAGLKLSKQLLFDFSGNNFGDLSNSWPPRVKRLMFFYEK